MQLLFYVLILFYGLILCSIKVSVQFILGGF